MPYKDKNKQKEYQLEWIKKRRTFWFAENGPCKHCGSWKKLELDHINPKDKISHSIWSWCDERRNKELAKCQVLCYDCHLKKSSKERCKGEQSGRSKYTEKQVLLARKLKKDGYSFKEIKKFLVLMVSENYIIY